MKQCWEDFNVGDKLVGPGRTITESHIVTYSGLTGDFHPLHTDAEYAKNEGPFGEIIAHGPLVLIMAMGLSELHGIDAIAWTGFDKARLVAVTKIGDTIHVVREIVEKTKKDDKSGLINFHFTIKNQRDEDVGFFDMGLLVHIR